MRFYNYEEIKANCDCVKIATETLGIQLNHDGRCAATWRGGDNQTAVHINSTGWTDFVREISGSAVDLVAWVRFGGDDPISIQRAQEFLGDLLGLQPVHETRSEPVKLTRYQQLIDDGYEEIARYDYTDELGNLVHQVVRMEHAEKPKEFLQCDSHGRWSLKDVTQVLYNLPLISKVPNIGVSEGEKDADAITALGIPCTCNAGGSKKWHKGYAEAFRGKNVAIFRDNDEPGEEHAKIVAASIIDVASSVRIICPSSKPKGDISDYINETKATLGDLVNLIKIQPEITEGDLAGICVPEQDTPEVVDAKQANRLDFRNFTIVKREADGQTKPVKEPRQINDLIKECHRRFLGFPKKVSEEMFDHDRDTGRIAYMSRSSELFSWMARKSGRLIDWQQGGSFVGREDFFQGVRSAAQRYESISMVPDWPTREDVYYSHKALPVPDEQHRYLEQFCSFFNPLNDIFKTALKAFIAAPIFYQDAVSRPLWVIDSQQAGSGKTSLAFAVARLYGKAPVDVKQQAFFRDTEEITKRLVSSEGRLCRMLLVDNVTGEFKSGAFSAMITAPDISGKAPYGRGEESRPNNLTYVITANKARLDNDLTIRSYFIQLGEVQYNSTWVTDLNKFIRKYRLNIMADIIDVLENHKPFDTAPCTRFPEFETCVLQAFCRDHGEYSDVIGAIGQKRSEANTDEDLGKEIEDIIRHELTELLVNPQVESVWIRSDVVNAWMANLMGGESRQNNNAVRDIAANGYCPNLDVSKVSYPRTGDRRRGVMWIGSDGNKNPTCVVGLKRKKAYLLHI